MTTNSLTFLFTWTPYLLQGFLWNVLIAIGAVGIGTVLGAGLAWLRIKKAGRLGRLAADVSQFFRGVPTLALIFYAVFVLPTEFTLPGTSTIIPIPQWSKAVLGLAAAPLAFTSESLVVAYRAWTKGDIGASLLFIPTWMNAFLISFVASSASSLVGVSELVSRGNFLIAAEGTHVMIPVYLYCGLIFSVTSLGMTALIKQFKQSAFMADVAQRLAAAHARRTIGAAGDWNQVGNPG